MPPGPGSMAPPPAARPPQPAPELGGPPPAVHAGAPAPPPSGPGGATSPLATALAGGGNDSTAQVERDMLFGPEGPTPPPGAESKKLAAILASLGR